MSWNKCDKFEAMLSHMYEPLLITVYGQVGVEACVAQQVTPRTLDLEVRCSSLSRCVVSLDKELYSTLSLFTQVYKWVPATYCWGVTLWWTSILSRGVVAILLGLLHAMETGISFGRVGLWLMGAFSYLTSSGSDFFYFTVPRSDCRSTKAKLCSL